MHILRALIFYTALALMVSGTCAYADQTRFFTALQDVPLMQGLTEINENTVVFDKPSGRIIESWAQTDATPHAKIMRYYQAVLPQFGWARTKDGHFARNNETLALEFVVVKGHNFLRVMVSPKDEQVPK